MPSVIINKLQKSFSNNLVLKNICLEINQAGIYLLLGHNGSGKSTLLKILAGLLRKNSGDIKMPSCAYFSHQLGVFDYLCAAEQIKLISDISRVKLNIQQIFKDWDFSFSDTSLIKDLSQGQKSKLSLAIQLELNRELILLDEPSANLDDASVEILRTKLHSKKNDSIIMIATHDIARLAEIADSILLLNNNTLLKDFINPEEALVAYRESNK